MMIQSGRHASANDSSTKSKHLCELEVKSCSQSKFILGKFSDNNMPKGFLIEFNDDVDPTDSVVSQITSLDAADSHRLMLVIENFGNKTISAEIRQLC